MAEGADTVERIARAMFCSDEGIDPIVSKARLDTVFDDSQTYSTQGRDDYRRLAKVAVEEMKQAPVLWQAWRSNDCEAESNPDWTEFDDEESARGWAKGCMFNGVRPLYAPEPPPSLTTPPST